VVPVSAFVPVDDSALQQRLSSDPELARYLVCPAPQGGLLVRAGVGIGELSRAFEQLGVVVEDGEA
jgi:hypothetical protein